MIFVTVGSTLPFDDLVRAVDRYVERGVITDEVVCQIGHGKYEPRHCEYFRFAPGLDEWLKKATIVIGHGGTGTVSGMLAEGKPFVAVPNPGAQDDHQAAFLQRLSQSVDFLWARDLTELPKLIAQAPKFRTAARHGEKLTDDLRDYLLQKRRQR